MKKFLLFTLSICIGFLAYSQDRTQISKELRNFSRVREYKVPTDPTPPMVNYNLAPSPVYKDAKVLRYNETEIIDTKYDLQSNTMLGNRLWVHPDGTMAAVCIRGLLDEGSFPDRGTGYNYFDGTAWGPKPSERIEDTRCGWPSYAAWGPTGEMVVAHNGVSGLEISKREVKGTGEWTQENYLGPAGLENDPTWPRLTTSGDDNEIIHMFYNSYVEWGGQLTALLYSRSIDGGEIWDPQDIILDELGEDYYFDIGADDYVLASKGDVVVLLIGGIFTDLFMMKSVNNGDDWEKIMVWENPYPFFDWNTTITTDTLYTCDNSADVAIDANGMCHVTWGVSRVAHDAVGTSYSYWPYTDGIGYWNEGMGEIEPLDNPHHTMSPANLEENGMLVGWAQDLDGSGGVELDEFDLMSYRELGISTMPSISVDDNGVVAVGYATVNEDKNNTVYYYKRIWVRTSPDLGYTWGEFYDVTDDIVHIFDECIYPVFAKNSTDTEFHLMYNADNIPGLFLDDDHGAEINRMTHVALLKDEIVSINDPNHVNTSEVTVSQNYPNPCNSYTEVIIEIQEKMQVSLEIFNIAGQKIFEIPASTLASGSHSLKIDASVLSNGIYFYTVTAGDNSITRKMIVN